MAVMEYQCTKKNAKIVEKNRKQKSIKRAGKRVHSPPCMYSELCEGGARVSKNATNLLHLFDGLSAQASESIGGDSFYLPVLLQVAMQHRDQKMRNGFVTIQNSACRFQRQILDDPLLIYFNFQVNGYQVETSLKPGKDVVHIQFCNIHIVWVVPATLSVSCCCFFWV